MNKFDRVISILILLQTKKITKAKSIAERFGTSLRTVYRDISTLKNAGIPIIGDPGIGYSIMEGYRLPPITFSEGEISALFTAEKFIGKITDQEIEANYTNAMIKIKAILRGAEKNAMEILDNSISIAQNSDWQDNKYLNDLFKCIAGKQVMELSYIKTDGSSSKRKIEPIGSYHQFNNWYLIAYCQLKEGYRTFKMKRIDQLVVLNEYFETEHISLQSYIDQQNTEWKEKQQFHSIEIVFDKVFLEFVESRKYYFGFVEQSIEENGVRMKFLNSSLEVMSRWLLQFGNKANVVAPIELKDRLRTLSAQLYKHYNT